ncbi:MAG: hypothetical protein ACLFMY_08180 [Guyparkeria sp.]|uniref:hypothetical protein n=1 Tax=Guyparkeria sp. TaxID=2035736 RepID=UPI00397E8788
MRALARLATVAGLAALLVPLSAPAQPPEHAGKPPQAERGGPPAGIGRPLEALPRDPAPEHRHDRHRDRYERDRFYFSERDRRHIQDWYSRNLPPGLAKQGKIPPGHAKRLSRGEPWPPRGLEYERLPRDLVRRLHPLPDHLRYYRVGTDVIIADMAGEVVADVVYDILNR